MARDLYDPVCRRYYKDRINDSINLLIPFRRKRKKFLDEYVGNDYGINQRTDDDAQIVAMVRQMVTIYTAALASANPECRVSSRYPQNAFFARTVEANVNNLSGLTELPTALYRYVMDSMIGLGIMKIGSGEADWIRSDDNIYSLAELPFADDISMDDWFGDLGSKKFSKMHFSGDDYWIQEEALRDKDLYDQKLVDKWIKKLVSRGHADDNGARASDLIGSVKYVETVGYRQFRVRDIFIPSHQTVYTIDVDMEYEPLASIDYSDKPKGPYRYLHHDPVPDNLMPIPPVDNIYAFSQFIDSFYRKLIEQGKDQKSVQLFSSGSREEADTVRKARNGSWVEVQDPKEIGSYSVPGPDQIMLGFMLSSLQIGEKQGGNYTAIAGLGAQTDTVGQEQIIQSQLNGMLDRMRNNILKSTSDIYQAFAYEIWPDNVGFRTSITLKEVGLPEEVVDRSWNPGDRQGDLSQYKFWVEPNSMVAENPRAAVQEVIGWIQQLIFPLSQTPQGQAEGMTLSLKDIVSYLADKTNRPELYQLVRFMGRSLVDPPDTNATQPPKMPQKREYRHVSGNAKPNDSMGDYLQMMSSANANNN